MGINKLGSLLKCSCARANISGKITYHSIRKSTVSTLSENGVVGLPPHKIIKVTGHKIVASVAHYDKEISLNEHKKISDILCLPSTSTSSNSNIIQNNDNVENTDYGPDEPVVQNLLNVAALPNFQGATFNGCTFHFNLK